jgi:hydrogenase-4 component E
MEIFIGWALLISAIILAQIRKISDAIGILVLQSLFLSLTAFVMWSKTDNPHLLIAALFTLLVKALLIPYILHSIIRKIDIIWETKKIFSNNVLLLIIVAISAMGYYMASKLDLPGKEFGETYLPVSIILIFLGVFIMICHSHAMMQGIGMITIENGIFLIAASVAYGMPMVVELGIIFDLLVNVIVIGYLLFRIHSTFGSLSTKNMQNLKG